MDTTGNIFLTEKLLTEVIERSQLSIGTVYFILKDITNHFEKLYYQQGQQEANRIIAEEQNKEKTSSFSKD